MASQRLELEVRVNAETGQLEIVGQKLKKTGEESKKTSDSFGGLSRSAAGLLRSLLPIASATGVIMFFRSAVKGAEEQNEAFRRLKFAVEANGQAWEEHEETVRNWTLAIGRATRFGNDEAIKTLEKLGRATGDVATGMVASKLAMDLSVASGKDLATVTAIVTDLVQGQDRALMQVRREFGMLAGNADTTSDALETLMEKVSGAAEKEESLTTETKSLSNAIGELKDAIAAPMLGPLTRLAESLTGVVHAMRSWRVVLADTRDKYLERLNVGMVTTGRIMRAVFIERDLPAAAAAMQRGYAKLEQVTRDSNKRLSEIGAGDAGAIDSPEEARQALIAQSRKRAAVKKSEEDSLARQKELEEAAKQAELIEQINMDLDGRLEMLAASKADKQRLALQQEIANRRAAISRQVHDEAAKQAMFAKLDQEELARSNELMALQVQARQIASLQIADTAIQTLAIVNSMSEKGTKAELNRAKAILALEKAIAIARVWSAPSTGPWDVGLKVAQTGLVVAQFAQQSRALSQAASAYQQGQTSLTVSTPLPGSGGGTIDRTFGSPVGGGGGGGSGGGGAGTVINMGGVVVNIQFDKLGIDNIRVVMREITERTRQGTLEGVQMALALSRAADKNQGVAL